MNSRAKIWLFATIVQMAWVSMVWANSPPEAVPQTISAGTSGEPKEAKHAVPLGATTGSSGSTAVATPPGGAAVTRDKEQVLGFLLNQTLEGQSEVARKTAAEFWTKQESLQGAPSNAKEFVQQGLQRAGLTPEEAAARAEKFATAAGAIDVFKELKPQDVAQAVKAAQTQAQAQGQNPDGKTETPEQKEAREKQEAEVQKLKKDKEEVERALADRNRLIDQEAARQQREARNQGEQGAGKGSGGDSGGSGSGGSGSKGLNADSGRNNSGLDNKGLQHIFDKLGASKGDSGRNDSSNVAQQLADALQKDKEKTASSSSSSSKGKGFLDDNDFKVKETPAPSPAPAVQTTPTQTGPNLANFANSFGPSELPNVLPSGAAAGADAFAAAAGGAGGGGSGGPAGGFGGNLGAAGDGGGASGADLLAGGAGVFGSIGAPDNYQPVKYNYVKFGEGDFAGASGGGEGGGSSASGSDSVTGEALGKFTAREIAEQIINSKALEAAGCTGGIMCLVGKMVRVQCKAGRLESVCRQGKSAQKGIAP